MLWNIKVQNKIKNNRIQLIPLNASLPSGPMNPFAPYPDLTKKGFRKRFKKITGTGLNRVLKRTNM